MKLKEAIKVLKKANKWRRYDGKIDQTPKMPNPTQFGIAIDRVIEEYEEGIN